LKIKGPKSWHLQRNNGECYNYEILQRDKEDVKRGPIGFIFLKLHRYFFLLIDKLWEKIAKVC